MRKLITAAIAIAWIDGARADCLGLNPTVYGEAGNWVNSDIQFALQVRKDIEQFGIFEEGMDINDDISMFLYARFFVSEDDTEKGNQVQGSMLYVDEKSISKEFKDPEDLELDDPFSKKRIEAQFHGQKFEGMFGDPHIFPLRYQAIESYFFDEDMNFAGVDVRVKSS